MLVRNPRFRVWSAAAQPDGYPDRIVERFRYTGPSAIRAVERGTADITADGLDQTWPPALAASLQTRHLSQLYPAPTARDPRALAEHEARAVQRRPRPAGAQPRGRPQPARPDQRRLREVACQYLPPNVNGYSSYCPYNGPDLARARRLVAESGTKGQPVTIWIYDITFGHRNGAYLVSVLRSIGYNARVEYVPHTPGNLTWRPDRQAGVQGWGGDYPSANNIFLAFLCSSYTTDPRTNSNFAGLCDRQLDAQVARAAVARDDQPRRGGRRLARRRPHADRRGAVAADGGLALHRLRRPAGRQLQVLLAVGGVGDDRRVPRPALGALSLVLASAVQRSECRSVRERLTSGRAADQGHGEGIAKKAGVPLVRSGTQRVPLPAKGRASLLSPGRRIGLGGSGPRNAAKGGHPLVRWVRYLDGRRCAWLELRPAREQWTRKPVAAKSVLGPATPLNACVGTRSIAARSRTRAPRRRLRLSRSPSEILLPAPVQEMHAANERNLDMRSNPTASCPRT